jgi:hypothetical protein
MAGLVEEGAGSGDLDEFSVEPLHLVGVGTVVVDRQSRRQRVRDEDSCGTAKKCGEDQVGSNDGEKLEDGDRITEHVVGDGEREVSAVKEPSQAWNGCTRERCVGVDEEASPHVGSEKRGSREGRRGELAA